MRGIVAVSLVVLSGLLASSVAWGQCTSHTDCKGGRVCNGGQCVDASCGKDTDCPGQQVCRASKCGAPDGGAGGAGAAVVRLQTRTVKESITWLWVTGLVLWGLDYVTGIGVAAGTSCESQRGVNLGYMLIPIAGPFVLSGVNKCPLGDDFIAPLVVAGVFQIIGAVAVIAGLAIKREVKVPVLSLGDGPNAAQLHFDPGLVGRDAWGINLRLTNW